MIYIITRKDDIHADLVVRHLHEEKVGFFRFNTDVAWEYETCLNPNGKSHIRNTVTGRELDFSTVKSVWLRRRSVPSIQGVPSEFVSLVESEWKLFFQNIWSSLQGAFWVSPPNAIDSARSKFEQLRRAREIGMDVPETVFTNSLTSVQSFLLENDSIIFKQHDMGALPPGSGKVLYTKVCDSDMLNNPTAEESLLICPGIFQQHIQKSYDVRVNVIGNQVFATEIRSTTEVLDWRRYNFTTLLHREVFLSDKLSEMCITLVKSFGLQFGAIDFAAYEDGHLVFLEINANGQWAWIQASTGQPISKAITRLLVG